MMRPPRASVRAPPAEWSASGRKREGEARRSRMNCLKVHVLYCLAFSLRLCCFLMSFCRVGACVRAHEEQTPLLAAIVTPFRLHFSLAAVFGLPDKLHSQAKASSKASGPGGPRSVAPADQ